MEPGKKLQVVPPASAPALPALRPLKTGDVGDLVVAIHQGSKIVSSSDEDLKKALRRIMLKLGIRAQNLPSEDEKMMLIDHIRMNFSDCTLEVICLAFEMAIGGKLDVDSNCYENFSCQYFSRIIESYRRWAKNELRAAAEGVLPLPPPEPKESLSNFAMLRWLSEEIGLIRTGKPWEFIPTELYDFLDKKGAIKVTKEQKYEYLQRATARRAGQLEQEALRSRQDQEYFQSFRRMMERGYLWGIEKERVKAMAKKLLFSDLVQKHNS